MKDKLFETMFDDLIKRAGTAAILEMEAECANEEVPEVKFSKEHEEKMKKFFEEYRLQQEEEERSRKVKSRQIGFRRAITLAATITVVLALCITTVGAWKGDLLNFYIKNNGEYSDVLSGKADRSLTVENVYFGYVPEGYEFEEVDVTSQKTVILFSSKQESTYFYLEMERETYKEKINTESGEISELLLNNQDMIYSERKDLKFVTWFENNTQNTAYTNGAKSMLIKIVENIKFLK